MLVNCFMHKYVCILSKPWVVILSWNKIFVITQHHTSMLKCTQVFELEVICWKLYGAWYLTFLSQIHTQHTDLVSLSPYLYIPKQTSTLTFIWFEFICNPNYFILVEFEMKIVKILPCACCVPFISPYDTVVDRMTSLFV